MTNVKYPFYINKEDWIRTTKFITVKIRPCKKFFPRNCRFSNFSRSPFSYKCIPQTHTDEELKKCVCGEGGGGNPPLNLATYMINTNTLYMSQLKCCLVWGPPFF